MNQSRPLVSDFPVFCGDFAWFSSNSLTFNDFDPAIFGRHPLLRLGEVRAWRNALNSLCRSFDIVMRNHLNGMLGADPWPP